MKTKPRLIDANALTEHIKDLPTWWADDGGFYGGAMKYPEGMFDTEDIISSIENAPTVDAVPVVRCKDCKHYDNSEGICWCHLNSKFYPGGTDWHSFPEDGFCSYGERREGE